MTDVILFLEIQPETALFSEAEPVSEKNCAIFINRDVTSAREFALPKRPPLPRIFPLSLCVGKASRQQRERTPGTFAAMSFLISEPLPDAQKHHPGETP